MYPRRKQLLKQNQINYEIHRSMMSEIITPVGHFCLCTTSTIKVFSKLPCMSQGWEAIFEGLFLGK